MNKLGIAIATSTALMATAASANVGSGAQLGTGFYLGGTVGAGTTQIKTRTVATDRAIALRATDKRHYGQLSGMLGAYAGYGFINCGAYYFGAELGVFFENTKVKLASDVVTASLFGASDRQSMKRKAIGTLAARIGFLPAKNVLIYGRVGAEYDHWKFTATAKELGFTARVSKSEGRIIPALGAGLEVALSNNVALRTEWVYQFNRKMHVKRNNNIVGTSETTSIHIHPHQQRATIGISYRF